MATATLSHSTAGSVHHPSFPIPDTYNPASAVVEAPISSDTTTTTTSVTNTIANESSPSLHATFNYYLAPADGSPPPPNYVNKPQTYDRPADPRVLPVHDIRGREENYTLDTAGFQVIKHASAERDFLDDDQIKRVYYPEVESILKEVTGASKVFVFDHTIRRGTQDRRSVDDDDDAAGKPSQPVRGPVQRVHVDQSYKAAPNRVTHHLPQEADRLLRGRFQIINLWRPIKTIRKDPLGVADARSVPDSDLVPVELIYPDRVGETFTVRPNENHRWFYLKEQQPNEVLLIKCFDSKTDGRARRVPHSAFVDESTAHEEARESIEVRSLVFHPDDIE